MENLRSLENPSVSDEQKAKIINEFSESEFLSDGNCNILEVLNIFINFLKNGDYQFFSESSNQKVSLEGKENWKKNFRSRGKIFFPDSSTKTLPTQLKFENSFRLEKQFWKWFIDCQCRKQFDLTSTQFWLWCWC